MVMEMRRMKIKRMALEVNVSFSSDDRYLQLDSALSLSSAYFVGTEPYSSHSGRGTCFA